MATEDVIAISVCLPARQATAVASVLKRMDAAVIHSHAALCTGEPEGDLANQGVTTLIGALSTATPEG